MTDFGVVYSGFNLKRQSDFISSLEDGYRAVLGDEANLTSDGVFGKILQITAAEMAEQEERIEAAYYASYKDSAESGQLDAVLSLLGIDRLDSARSTVTLRINGSVGTTVPEGTVFTNPANSEQWIVRGEYEIGTGETFVDAALRAETAGPKVCSDATAWSYSTIAGLTSIDWIAGGLTTGREIETDVEYRARSEETLKGLGGGSIPGIIAALENVDGVTRVTIRENRTAETDGEGLPPHSIQIIVAGEYADQNIYDTLHNVVSAGIQMVGGNSGTVTAINGQSFEYRFEDPENVPIYIDVGLTTNGDFPVNGTAQVEESILAYAAALDLGDDVPRYYLEASYQSIPGIVTSTLKFGTSANPTTDSDIPISNIQIAALLSENIDVSAA